MRLLKTYNLIFIILAVCFTFTPKAYPQDPRNFEGSLHYTRAGAEYWYRPENGGFGLLTRMSISKDCINCHAGTNARGNKIIHSKYVPSCVDCHDKTNSNSVNNEACRECHTHQMSEISVSNDVHREKGMICIDCHTKKDMHGDGNYINSIYEGAIENSCESCHKNISPSASHTVHNGKLDCSACHMQTEVTCFNCHFESGRINNGLYGYVLLAKNSFTKKVQAANFMGLTFYNKTFLAVSPYKAHSISKEGRKCRDCHGNPTVKQYVKTKKIILTRWNGDRGKIEVTQGVIPVPKDWKSSFVVDFTTYNPSNSSNARSGGWQFLKRGADLMQMLFLEPLDEEAIKKLSFKK